MIPAQPLLPVCGWRLLPESAAVAIIVVDCERVLMQHRDCIAGIVYPGFWGCFGGAMDRDEEPIEALRRELFEELKLNIHDADYFTAVDYDFEFCGKGRTKRLYYVVHITKEMLATLELGEGDEMRTFTFAEILAERDVVPFDVWALWMYANRASLAK